MTSSPGPTRPSASRGPRGTTWGITTRNPAAATGAGVTVRTATALVVVALWYFFSRTLAGKAISFSTGSYLYINGVNSALTLGPTSSGTGEISIYPSSSAGTAFTNQGTLTHTGGSSSIYAGTMLTVTPFWVRRAVPRNSAS